MATALSVLFIFLSHSGATVLLKHSMRRSLFTDLKPSEVTILMWRIWGEISYEGLKASEIKLNCNVTSPELAYGGCQSQGIMFQMPCFPPQAQTDRLLKVFIIYMQLSEMLWRPACFYCPCRWPDSLSLQPISVGNVYTHARAPMCEWDGAFVTMLTVVPTVSSFSFCTVFVRTVWVKLASNSWPPNV